MPKLDPLTTNKIQVPESLDTNARTKPLVSGGKVKHDRDTAGGMDDISSWVDENDTAARAASAAAQHALDWLAIGSGVVSWGDVTEAELSAGYALRFSPVGRDPAVQIPQEASGGVLTEAGSWNLYVTLPNGIPTSRIRVQQKLVADESVLAEYPSTGNEWTATSFPGLHDNLRAFRLVLSANTSDPVRVDVGGGMRLCLQLSGIGQADVLTELEQRKTIGLTDGTALHVLSQTSLGKTFVDTGEFLTEYENGTIWAIEFANVLYQFSPVAVRQLEGFKTPGTDVINGENEIDLGAFGAVAKIETDDGPKLAFAAKVPLNGTVSVREVMVGPDTEDIDRQITTLLDLTQDLQVPPTSTGWVDATSDSQCGIYVHHEHNIGASLPDLAFAQALTDSDFVLRSDSVGLSTAIVRIPAGHESAQVRTHLGTNWGLGTSERLNTYIYLGRSTDNRWDLYVNEHQYGSGVDWVYMQVTASYAHVGKTVYSGTLSHEGVIDAIGPGGIEASELAEGAVTEEKLAEGAVTEEKLAERAVTREKLSATVQQELTDVRSSAVVWHSVWSQAEDSEETTIAGTDFQIATIALKDLEPNRPYELIFNGTFVLTDAHSAAADNNVDLALSVGGHEYPLTGQVNIDGYAAQSHLFRSSGENVVSIWPTAATAQVALLLRSNRNNGVTYTVKAGAELLIGQGVAAGSRQQALYDFDELPDPETHEVRDVVIARDTFYKLGVSDDGDGVVASVYKGTVGYLYYNNALADDTWADTWTGVASIKSPSGVSTGGEWLSNPDNAISMIAASGNGYIQVALSKQVFETFKGSSLDIGVDQIHMDLVLESGRSDQTTLLSESVYQVDGEDYVIFQFGPTLDGSNYHLYSEDPGNTFSATFYVGGDTSGTEFTHPASEKHWLAFSTTPGNVRNTRVRDLPALPNVDDYDVNDLIVADHLWYKAAVSSTATPDLFEGTVGQPEIAFSGGGLLRWRGVSDGPAPTSFDMVVGSWTSNPDNALTLLMASNDGRMVAAMKLSAYEEAKGSGVEDSDKIAIEITLADGAVDRAVLSYSSTYSSRAGDLYVEWQARTATDGENFNLKTADYDSSIGIRFFTVDADGVATTTPLLTHGAGTKHWILFSNTADAATRAEVAQAQQTADAAQARLDAIDNQVDGDTTPLHSVTYDDTTPLLAPASGYARDLAVATYFDDIEPDDLLVVDWKKCAHLNNHDEHIVPGSTDDAGRMYFYPSNFDASKWNGEFVNALEKALQDNGDPDVLNSWIVGTITYAGSRLGFGLHLQQGGPRANRNLMARPGFSLSLRIFRNTTIFTATEGSVTAQIKELRDDLSLVKERFTYSKAFDASAAVHSLGTVDGDSVPDYESWRTMRIYVNGVISTIPWPADRITLPDGVGGLSKSHPGLGPVTLRALGATGSLSHPYFAQVFADEGEYKITFRGTDGGQFQQAYLEKIEIDYVT